MSQPKNKSYLHGAAILTASVIVVKIIGAIYKIPLANLLGSEGSGYFGVAYNIYALLMSISTVGLPVALSKMISNANALGRPNQVKKIFTVGRRVFLICGLVFGLAMFLFPRQLAGMMNSPDAWYSIRALSPAMFFICLISAYRGYAQGFSDMIPTSVSQTIEAFCKLLFGLSLAWLLINRGYSLPIAAAGAILGVSIGTGAAFLFTAIYKRKKMDRNSDEASGDIPDSGKKIVEQILRIGIPITLGASIISLINLADTKLIMYRLQYALDFSYDTANSLYGTYFNVQTLSNLPSALISPLTISIIPSIVAYLSRKDDKSAAIVAESGLKMTNLLTMATGVGLSVLSYSIVNVIYPSIGDEAPGILLIMGLSSYFVCLYCMTNAILQSYGFERYSVCTVPIGGIIKVIANWILLGIPGINIYGAAIGTVACYLTICGLNIILILKKIPNPPKIFRAFVKPMICNVGMGAAAFLSYQLLERLLAPLITGGFWRFSADWLLMCVSMIGAIVVACAVYLILIVVLRAITYEDMKMFPKGEKLAKVLKIR